MIRILNFCYLILSGCLKHLFSILIQYKTWNRMLWLLVVRPSFSPSFFSQYLPLSRQIFSMFYVIWYVMWGTFFWNFHICTDNILLVSSIFHLLHPLYIFYSLSLLMLDISYMWTVRSQYCFPLSKAYKGAHWNFYLCLKVYILQFLTVRFSWRA